MIFFTGGDGDQLGTLIMAIGMIALVSYLVPGMMSLSPQWERRLNVAAIAFLVVAMALAIIASVAWYMG